MIGELKETQNGEEKRTKKGDCLAGNMTSLH
jgi:hypothetical protein